MAFILTRNNENVSYGLIDGYVETEAEISTLSTGHRPGSHVQVIESGNEYVLNNNKEWVVIPKF